MLFDKERRRVKTIPRLKDWYFNSFFDAISKKSLATSGLVLLLIGCPLSPIRPRFLPSYRVDRILVIDLEAYSVEEVLCLPDAVYNSIAVHEGALYAYNYQGSLDKLN